MGESKMKIEMTTLEECIVFLEKLDRNKGDNQHFIKAIIGFCNALSEVDNRRIIN